MENDIKVMFRHGKIALLDTPNEYIVATDYDWITRKWSKYKGYIHYGNLAMKVKTLELALGNYMSLTENGTYITRIRALDLATRFKDVAVGDEDISEVLNDMDYNEKKFFGITSGMESEDWL